MQTHEQRVGAVLVVKPEGPLAQADAQAFKERLGQLLTESMGRVVVDASAVPFVDSAGLEALVELTERVARSGRALKLCATGETLRQVLELTGWAGAFEFFDDVAGGVRSFL